MVRPPREGRSLGGRYRLRPLFRASCRAVRLPSGADDQHNLRRISASGEGGKDALPDAVLAYRSAGVAFGSGFQRLKTVGTACMPAAGASAAAFAQTVYDAVDHTAGVHAPWCGVDHRRIWRDRRPLHIVPPEHARHASSPAVWQSASSRPHPRQLGIDPNAVAMLLVQRSSLLSHSGRTDRIPTPPRFRFRRSRFSPHFLLDGQSHKS